MFCMQCLLMNISSIGFSIKEQLEKLANSQKFDSSCFDETDQGKHQLFDFFVLFVNTYLQ